MESAGNVGCPNRNPNGFFSTLHWGRKDHDRYFMSGPGQFSGPDLSEDFHTYKLEWTEQFIKTYIDGNLVLSPFI